MGEGGPRPFPELPRAAWRLSPIALGLSRQEADPTIVWRATLRNPAAIMRRRSAGCETVSSPSAAGRSRSTPKPRIAIRSPLRWRGPVVASHMLPNLETGKHRTPELFSKSLFALVSAVGIEPTTL